ncbi:hypothetical protein TrRE_jg5353 [Triparma retinervis]|uniref:Uncharacterized protein n=1 Tax=Triparma retinervis TaxID=2557542 RepID=A0A9W6ZPJ3_9STRA|nr:hypothetical protein TrRE_jg5353 [Triparma retinervis]
MQATASVPSRSARTNTSKRKAPSASSDSSGYFVPRKRVVSGCDNEVTSSASSSNVEMPRLSRSTKSFKNLLSCSTMSSSTTSVTSLCEVSSSNAKIHNVLPPVCPRKPHVTPNEWEGDDVGCVSDDSGSFNSLSVAGTNDTVFAPADSADNTDTDSETCSVAGFRSVDPSTSKLVSNVTSPTSATKVPVAAPHHIIKQLPLDQWGWFVKMDNTSLDNRPLVAYPKQHSTNLDNVQKNVRLAFVTDDTLISSADHPVQQEDATLRWATAADTVDEVLGGLDLPEL